MLIILVVLTVLAMAHTARAQFTHFGTWADCSSSLPASLIVAQFSPVVVGVLEVDVTSCSGFPDNLIFTTSQVRLQLWLQLPGVWSVGHFVFSLFPRADAVTFPVQQIGLGPITQPSPAFSPTFSSLSSNTSFVNVTLPTAVSGTFHYNLTAINGFCGLQVPAVCSLWVTVTPAPTPAPATICNFTHLALTTEVGRTVPFT